MASSEKKACVEKLPMYTVDAFTDTPFYGNAAAVCLLPANGDLGDDVLQKIAAEMNLSETAFIKRLNPSDTFESGNKFGLRWLTPKVEVALCGHATVAAAAVLFKKLNNTSEKITFSTKSGDLFVQAVGDYISMDFPTGVTQTQEQSQWEKSIKVLFSDPSVVEEVAICPVLRYLVIRIKDGWTREEFESWNPPLTNLESTARPGQLVGIIVTTKGTAELGYTDSENKAYDFASRFFAPWAGILEDPVTGSAHTVLPHFWSSRLEKTEFYGRQCSSRGGDILMSLKEDRAHIKGKATFVLDGSLYL